MPCVINATLIIQNKLTCTLINYRKRKSTHSPTKEQLARDARKEQLLIIRKWRIYYITNEITHGFFHCQEKKPVPCFRYVLESIRGKNP